MYKKLSTVLLLGLLIHSSLSLPYPESDSSSSAEDEDIQQQQQQTIDTESLEEFTKQIKTRGKKVEKLKDESVEENDPCLQPRRVGRCRAFIPRIYFNKNEGKCEQFIFGGCHSNKNNFKTLAECESVCSKHLPIASILPHPVDTMDQDDDDSNKEIAPTTQIVDAGKPKASVVEEPGCANVNCPWELYTHYTSLGCKPIYDGLSCCPTRFDCPDKEQNNTIEGKSLTLEESPVTAPTKCQYRGKFYEIGENVLEASDTGNCRASCICTYGHGANPQPKITCANIECPEQFGYVPPGKADCVPVYKKGSCCAHDFFCPNDTLRIIDSQQEDKQESIDLPTKCSVDGRSYYEGQRFYPEKSCQRCICQKGFNGTLSGEFCEAIDCGIEIHYSEKLAKGCAPVHFVSSDGITSCCPISWECPDEQQTIPMTSTTPASPPSQTPSGIGPVPVTPILENGGPVPVTPATAPPLVVPTSSTVEIFIPPSQNNTKNLMLSIDSCDEPKEIGNCKGSRRRAYYNKANNTCEEFLYSGCGGNKNNFVSMRDCQRLCINYNNQEESTGENRIMSRTMKANRTPQQSRSITATEQDPCTMPKKQGICKGYFHRYYYSPEDNSCKLFIYGGCGKAPIDNNFYSKESCEATCTNSIGSENLRTSIPTGGDASMVNFAQEEVSPSANRNPSLDVVDPCTLPKRTGRCRAYVTRFYYDSKEKQCSQFVYGLCGKNENNFESKEECERKCPTNTNDGGESPKSQVQVQPTRTAMNDNAAIAQDYRRESAFGFLEKCRLPKKSGTCLALIPSYYYDAETEGCIFFLYSGCFGNANRFQDRDQCEAECKTSASTALVQNEGIGARISPKRIPWRPTVNAANDDDTTVTEINTASAQERDNETCSLPPQLGPCKKHVLRYHWDPTSMKCLPFVFSGCRPNKNNFLTESDCLSACGTQPTIEQLTDDGILSCVFGNETLPLGAKIIKGKRAEEKLSSEEEEKEIPCGVPICQCVTPPSVTCVQKSCPTPPPTTTTEKICPTPTCGEFCTPTIGLDGCPTCDCDEELTQQEVMEIY